MSLFIIHNSRGEFLDKQLNWVSGDDASVIFNTPHRDVALNQLIELNARDIHLRARVVHCESDGKGRPRLASMADETIA